MSMLNEKNLIFFYFVIFREDFEDLTSIQATEIYEFATGKSIESFLVCIFFTKINFYLFFYCFFFNI